MAIEVRFKIFKDPCAAWTHFLGFLGSIVGLVLLVVLSAHDGPKVTAMAIYGGTLVALFGASSMYHFFDLGYRGNRWLRRIDHSAIFLLIAGTYVPVTMHLLDGAWRISMLAVVGTIALAGVILKVVWLDCPDWLGMSLYIGLGWLVVVPAYRIVPQLDPMQLFLLVSGGLAYMAGVVVFLLERPNPFRVFGHHEIWHVLVLAGASGHFLFTWDLLDQAVPPF